MKRIITIILLCSFFVSNNNCRAQLTLSGTGSSYSKGTINTEVLTQVIQQKQDEIKTYVFKNLILKSFRNADGLKDLKNFSTDHYIDELMTTITSGENKTSMTKDLFQESIEFALIFSFAEYCHNYGISDEINSSIAAKRLNIKSVSADKGDFGSNKMKIDNSGKLSKYTHDSSQNFGFNVLMDMSYDILLNSGGKDPIFKFKEDTTNNSFKTWYLNDNVIYDKDSLAAGKTKIDAAYIPLQTSMKKKLDSFIDDLMKAKSLYATAQSLVKDAHKPETITLEGFAVIRTVLNKFIVRTQSEFPKNFVAVILGYVTDNTIIDYNDSGVAKNIHIDVESVVSEIFEKYGQNNNGKCNTSAIWFVYPRPFFSIGTNAALFINKNNGLGPVDASGNAASINSLYFASEKIGFKFMLFDNNYKRSFKPGEIFKYHGRNGLSWKRPQPEAFITDAHIMLYGSGLLYNIVDTKSDKNFNYAIIGASFGITFFNGLNPNIGYGIPFTGISNLRNRHFINFGIDIPIFDYISALGSKKS